jgi:hypothetical protein
MGSIEALGHLTINTQVDIGKAGRCDKIYPNRQFI